MSHHHPHTPTPPGHPSVADLQAQLNGLARELAELRYASLRSRVLSVLHKHDNILPPSLQRAWLTAQAAYNHPIKRTHMIDEALAECEALCDRYQFDTPVTAPATQGE